MFSVLVIVRGYSADALKAKLQKLFYLLGQVSDQMGLKGHGLNGG
jgi:hypothetical protein